MLYFLAYSGLISGIATMIFGLFVYLRNKHNPINYSYGLLSLALGIWGIPYFFWPLAKTKAEALLSFQLLHVGAILVAPTYVWFILALLNLHRKFKKFIIACSITAGFMLLFVPTPLFIQDMVPQYIFRYWAIPGIMYHIFLLLWFGCIVFVWSHLWKHFRHAIGIRKTQLKYVLFATVFGILGGATNYLPWYKIYVPPVGTILVAVHVVVLAYAIMKYRLMNISITITRAGIFLAVYTVVLGVPFLLATYYKQQLINLLGTNWWLVPLTLMALLGTIGPFVYLFFKNKAEAILLREQRQCQTIIKNATVDLTRIRNLQKLLDFVARSITESIRISHSAIYFFDNKESVFILKSGVEIPKKQPETISTITPIIPWFKENKDAIITAEIQHMREMDKRKTSLKQLEHQLNNLHAAAVIPCFLENKLLNIIVLGEKLSGQIYNQEDINNFKVLAEAAALATENALLYDKIENEVKERTQELVVTQKQLVQAEKLATVGTLAGGVAHEINNPLTAILTNTQMLIATGELDEEALKMIEEATKRCKIIVQKLMTYAKKPLETSITNKVNIADVIETAISFLRFQLEQDNIHLFLHFSDKQTQVLGNPNELEQVITNIVLNAKDAIKQLKKEGSIEINVSANDKNINITIKDDGIGIPKTIINRIFDPFFTTKDVGKGLGLGLSICHSIIEKHNGTIKAESEPNKGATFYITLPKVK